MKIAWHFFCLGMQYHFPLIINDVADVLYWLHDVNSPMVLWSIYNVLAYHLLHVCTVDEQHIHPSEAHF